MQFLKKKKEQPDFSTSAETREHKSTSHLDASAPKKGELIPGLSVLLLARIVFAIILLVVGAVVTTSPAVVVVLQVIAALAAGYDLVLAAIDDVRNKDFTKDSLPVLLAAVLSFLIGRGTEGVIVLLILQAAYILRAYALDKTASTLMASVSEPDDALLLSLGSRAAQSVCTEASITIENGYKDDTDFQRLVWRYLKFLPAAMLAVAVIITVICAANADIGFTEGLRRAVTVLAIAAPVSVMLAVPVSYLSAMVAARKASAVIKTAEDLDKAANIKTMVFDKTGTVTGMNFAVAEIKSDKMDSDMLLKVAAHAICRSKGPEAAAVVTAYGGHIDPFMLQEFKEFPGKGIESTLDGIHVLFGSEAFLKDYGVAVPKAYPELNCRYMAFNRQYAGEITLTETVNSEIYDTISTLGKLGVDRIAMVSANSRESDRSVAGSLGIAEYFAECSQEEKVKHVSELKGKTDSRSTMAYVGCGGDIGPICAASDLSFALGCADENLRPDCVDVAVLGKSVSSVPKTISVAKKNRLWVMAEIAAMLFIKLLVAVLAAVGVAPVWFGLTLDVCISLLVTVDALRPSRFGERQYTPED